MLCEDAHPFWNYKLSERPHFNFLRVCTGTIYSVTHKNLRNGAFSWSAELIKPCFLWSNALHPDTGPISVPATLLHGAAACAHRLACGQEADYAAVGMKAWAC